MHPIGILFHRQPCQSITLGHAYSRTVVCICETAGHEEVCGTANNLFSIPGNVAQDRKVSGTDFAFAPHQSGAQPLFQYSQQYDMRKCSASDSLTDDAWAHLAETVAQRWRACGREFHILGQRCAAWPDVLIWCPQSLEDLPQLVQISLAREPCPPQ